MIRRDLPLGALAAQLAHAVGQSVDGPHASDMFVVVLAAPDEPALQAHAARLEAAGVPLVRVVEVDGPLAGQLTALGLRPGRREVLRKHLSSLPLLR